MLRAAAAPAARRLLRGCAPAARWKYSEAVESHYEKPRNVGSLDKNDPNVGTGVFGAPACGDFMKFQVEYDDASGTITNAAFKTFGCGSAIASSSYATEQIKGKTLDEAVQMSNRDIAAALSLPPVKIHCSLLAEGAVKAAVRDLVKKRPELKTKVSEDLQKHITPKEAAAAQ